MTAPDVAESTAPAKPAPLWEDFIDIFHAPSEVFERRRNANPWPMILIITVLMTAITVLTFNSLSPVYESELRAAIAKQMAKNPQITQDAMESGMGLQMGIRKWQGVFFPIGVLIIGLPVWLLGRIVGAKELTYTRALVVVAWGSIFAVLTALIFGVQGLVLDVSTITSSEKLALGLARFMNKESTPPFLYGAAKLVDVLQIWGLVVMATGVRVVGRGTKNSMIAFIAVWLGVAMLISGVVAMRSAL